MLWKVVINKNYSSRQLLDHALRVVASKKNDAEVSGALLYIGKFANKSEKLGILKYLNENDSFMIQRHFLIAIQELSFEKIKEIAVNISKENKGTYRKLNNSSVKNYLVSPKSIHFTDLFNQVGFYV